MFYLTVYLHGKEGAETVVSGRHPAAVPRRSLATIDLQPGTGRRRGEGLALLRPPVQHSRRFTGQGRHSHAIIA